MPLMRLLSILLLSFLITACGGGGTIEKDGTVSDDDDSTTYTLTLQGYTKSDASASNSVSAASPLTLSALLKNEDGDLVSDQLVTFTLNGTVGVLSPSSALTQSDGLASVELSAGTVAGAGEVTASYSINDNTYENTFSFSSTGDDDSTTESDYVVTLQGYSQVDGSALNSVSANSPLNIVATLTSDSNLITGQLITFSLSDDIGVLTPESAITQENGQATVVLTSGDSEGASEITAGYTINGVSYTDTFAFQSDGEETVEPVLSVSLISSSSLIVRNVDYLNPAVAQAELLIDGLPGAFKLIEFSLSGLGTINPSSGTAMTNEAGIAKVDLLAGTESGAGSISATFTDSDNNSYSAEAFTFTTEGDSPEQGDDDNFTIDLSLISSTTLNQISEVSSSDNGLVQALVLDSNSDPVVNGVVTFTSTLGSLLPSSGTALTNVSGIASLNFAPGTIEGAGTVTAQYEGVEESIGFYTRGDAVDPDQSTADISFKILENCSSDFSSTRDASLCDEVTSIAGDSNGILYIEVTNENSTTPLTQTLVTATTTIGSITPTSGTAITDSNGVALLAIVPDQDVGAGEITVTVLDSSLTKAFQIAAVDVEITINSTVADNQVLAAGATALITIEIFKDNEAYTTPLTVEFSSGCVSSGQALIDESVTSIGGEANSTYRPLTCVGGDIITATVITGGDTVSASTTINVSEADVGFIQFIDVSQPVIALKGTGGADRTEISEVTFKLVDSNGNDLASKTIDFQLSTDVGGITLGSGSAITNSSGEVTTTVLSGSVATPVRVIASIEDDSGVLITAPSDTLVISTGIADQNSFSISRSEFNPHGLNIDGTEVTFTARLADHFNNPVPDGTAVSFITEGGTIEPNCTTISGACSVIWTSTNPRPFTDSLYANTIAEKCDDGRPCPLGILNNDFTVDLPLGGRATVMAYAIGEETFSDLNGNGYFDSEDFFDDLFDIPEAFVDHNEDGSYGATDCSDVSLPCSSANSQGDEFEDFIDFDGNSSWTIENGLYNGLLCQEDDEADGICSRNMVNVFQNQEIIMSGDTAYFRLVTYADDCSAIVGATASEVHVNSRPSSPVIRLVQSDDTSAAMCQVSAIDLTQTTGASSVSLTLFIADLYNNPMPVGTEVSMTTDNGELTGDNIYTFPNTTSMVPISISFGIKREPDSGGNDSSTGSLTISVEAPSGLVSPFSVTVIDDL